MGLLKKNKKVDLKLIHHKGLNLYVYCMYMYQYSMEYIILPSAYGRVSQVNNQTNHLIKGSRKTIIFIDKIRCNATNYELA